MTENAATPPLNGPSSTSEPFVRPREGRMLAGVCAGIAQRWGFDVTLVRIIAVALTLLSGFGIAVYVAAWLLSPSPDAPAPLRADSSAARAVARAGERIGRRWPTILLIVLAAIVLTAVLHSLWFGFPVGLFVFLVVVALIIGTRKGRWIVATMLLLLVAVGAAVGVFGSDLGSRSYTVASVRDLQWRYDYPVGKLSLDLTGMTSISGRHQTEIRVGRGDVNVVVPSGLPVVVRAQSGVGSVTIDGHRVSGVGAEQTRSIGSTDLSTSQDQLLVVVQVGAGNVLVRSV